MSIINSENDGIISTEFEQLLLTAKECFVYKVPPLKSASGHRYKFKKNHCNDLYLLSHYFFMFTYFVGLKIGD